MRCAACVREYDKRKRKKVFERVLKELRQEKSK